LPAELPGRDTPDGSWSQRVRAFADGRSPAVYWYFVSDGRADGSAWFVGYDSKSRMRIGYLGTAGFRAEMPPAEERIPFTGKVWGENSCVLCTQRDGPTAAHPDTRLGGRAPQGFVSPWDVYVLARGGKLYHADLHQRCLRLALDEPNLRSAALTGGGPDPRQGTPHRLVARTGDAVLLLDERGRALKRYTIPEVLRHGDLRFAETTTGEALLYWNSPHDVLVKNVTYRIAWVSEDGRCREARTTVAWEGPFPPEVIGGLVPSPLVLAGLVGFAYPPTLLENGMADTYPEALARSFVAFRPTLLLAQLVAAGFALLCYGRQRRYGASRSECLAWVLFVLVLGLPGWIGYRFGRSWPALVRCGACGSSAPLDREGCARCAADFPRPALAGTEVFA
jgi:hypothetical protein